MPSVEYPSYPGHEGAGVVEDVGSAVNRLSPGDNVAGLGSGWFAEHNVTSASNAARIPDRIEDWSRWGLEPLACCINGVDVAGIMADDVIGVVGCGFMGLGLLRCLIASPARLRVGFDVRPDRLQLARENGADAAFDVDSPQLHQALEDLIRRRPMRTTFGSSSAANGPFDVVFEAAGDPRALNMAAQLLRVGGTLVMFGFQHGRVSVDAQMWHLKGIRVLNASPMIAADFHQIFYRTVGLVERGIVDMDGLITIEQVLRESNPR